MQTVQLRSPQPEAGTDVTRLWLAPGCARIGAVLGNTIQNNGVVICWDATARRALWEANLYDTNETFPDPDFDRDLTRVVFTRYSEDAEEEQEADLALRGIASGAEVRLGGPWSHFPALTPDGRHAIAIAVHEGTRTRELRRWPVSPASGAGRDLKAARDIEPDRKWAIRLPGAGRSYQQQIDSLVTALAISPDGKRVAAGRHNGSVTVWNFATRRRVTMVPALKGMKYVRFSAHRLAFSPDGTRLAVVRGKWIKKRYRFQVSVWSLPSGEQQKGPNEKESVNGIAFSPDGRTLLTAREDKTIGVWDTATWKLQCEYAWKIGKLFSVTFAPDGLTCAAGGEDGRIVIWDVDT